MTQPRSEMELMLYRQNPSNQWFQAFNLGIDYSIGLCDGPEGSIAILRFPEDFTPPPRGELGLSEGTLSEILGLALEPIVFSVERRLQELVRLRALAVYEDGDQMRATERVFRRAVALMNRAIQEHETKNAD